MTAPTLIALISQKGGSGKTTVAMQLAAGLALEGYRVALADLDPQESASRWAASAPLEAPFAAEVLRLKGSAAEMSKALRPVANKVDIVVMDCPPSISIRRKVPRAGPRRRHPRHRLRPKCCASRAAPPR